MSDVPPHTRHGFFDRDVFFKLACCDLWADTLAALGITQAYRLASAKPAGFNVAFRRAGVDGPLKDTIIERLRVMAGQAAILPPDWSARAVGDDLFNALIRRGRY